MRCNLRSDSVRSSIILSVALEAIIRLVHTENAITIDTNLVLRDEILLFLTQPLAREESILLYVSVDLL